MYLSNQQMAAVNHGTSKDVRAWELVDLPTGPQSVPAWAKGLDIWWGDGYANNPDFKLKTDRDLRAWPDKRFHKEGARYMAQSADGRAEVYYHDGLIRLTKMQRCRRVPGRQRHEPPQTEDYEALATTQQEGFGGAHIWCDMTGKGPLRGKRVCLRGPWHGAPPDGWIDISYVDSVTRRPWYRDTAHWTKRTARGGLYLREDVFIRIFARFCPNLRLARVSFSGVTELAPLKPEWDAPKQWMLERDRRAA